MILTKEQINRYMRHIIIPEISGPGQKKLMESTTLIYAHSVKHASPLIYYLAASGIGRILCCFEDSKGCDELIRNINDLNADTAISLLEHKSWVEGPGLDNYTDSGFIFRIITGPGDSAIFNKAAFSLEGMSFIPTIACANRGWKGVMKVFKDLESLKYFSENIPASTSGTDSSLIDGSVFSSCLLGALSCIEGIKLCLNIGTVLDELLYFDLLSMEFDKVNLESMMTITASLRNSISTKVSVKERNLCQCSALIVGTGGLGSPNAYALAWAGIGKIGLVDYDTVEISNLNRQILHSSSRIGMPKTESAKSFLEKLNPDVEIVSHNNAFSKENAADLVKDYDIILDGLDNFPTRYLLNDVCYFAKKPMIEAGVLRFDGMGFTIIPDEGPCYRCMKPEMPSPGATPSCSETGVLGPVPGVLGFIEAAEAVKVMLGIGNPLKERFLFYNALDTEFLIFDLKRSPNCPICGQNPSIKELQEYTFVCSDDKKE